MLEAALEGCERAVQLTLQLSAGYLFFCGMMEVAQAMHAQRLIARLMQPLLGRLMPSVRTREAKEAVALNLSMNVLGLGNAATPMGMEAMRQMETERSLQPKVRHDMYMLLILNATGLQLLPTTILTLRAAAESAHVNAVLLPTVACTAFSTLMGAGMGWICRKWEEKHGG